MNKHLNTIINKFEEQNEEMSKSFFDFIQREKDWTLRDSHIYYSFLIAKLCASRNENATKSLISEVEVYLAKEYVDRIYNLKVGDKAEIEGKKITIADICASNSGPFICYTDIAKSFNNYEPQSGINALLNTNIKKYNPIPAEIKALVKQCDLCLVNDFICESANVNNEEKLIVCFRNNVSEWVNMVIPLNKIKKSNKATYSYEHDGGTYRINFKKTIDLVANI